MSSVTPQMLASLVDLRSAVGSLPSAFCWTKFGVEAGEPVTEILARKERERLAGTGTFLWGIGTSIRPSLPALLARETEPEVLFSPMLSRPAAKDVAPSEIVRWHAATDVDGQRYELPRGAVVTSRRTSRRRHYALVCHTDSPLPAHWETAIGWLDDLAVRNLVTGRALGSSQVTSIVQQLAVSMTPRYRVSFRARLAPPHLVVLEEPELL